jgi:hypothetical protein
MNNAHMRMINLHVFLCSYDEEIKEKKMHVGDHHASKMFLQNKIPFSLTYFSISHLHHYCHQLKKNNLETIKNNSHE